MAATPSYKRAAAVAERCEDAYSSDRYTSWPACANVLLGMGYDEAQTEAILRSKVTRWAADASDKPYGRSTSADLTRFLERCPVSKEEATEWASHDETGYYRRNL